MTGNRVVSFILKAWHRLTGAAHNDDELCAQHALHRDLLKQVQSLKLQTDVLVQSFEGQSASIGFLRKQVDRLAQQAQSSERSLTAMLGELTKDRARGDVRLLSDLIDRLDEVRTDLAEGAGLQIDDDGCIIESED